MDVGSKFGCALCVRVWPVVGGDTAALFDEGRYLSGEKRDECLFGLAERDAAACSSSRKRSGLGGGGRGARGTRAEPVPEPVPRPVPEAKELPPSRAAAAEEIWAPLGFEW